MNKRRIAATTAVAMALAVVSTGPAEAATQGTACTDGANRVWRAKASWGGRYRAQDGTEKVRITSVAWTTGARSLRTQSEITPYSPGGRQLPTVRDDRDFDYRDGSTWSARNPENPTAGATRARVTLKLGLHGSADCLITFTEPTVGPSGALVFGVPASSSGATVVTATAVTSTSATLAWTAVTGATDYLVGRSGSDAADRGAWSRTVPATVSSQTFTNLLPGSSYRLFVEPRGGARRTVVVTTAPGSPTSPAGGTRTPSGVPGAWRQVFGDEFDGGTLDAYRWSVHEGRVMNNVRSHASNVKVSGGQLVLTLASSTSGAFLSSYPPDVQGPGSGFELPVGGVAEARVHFAGEGRTIYNWPAWWLSAGSWPAGGESDVAEGLGRLTVNYHSPSGAHNQGPVPGSWAGAYHTYSLHRKARSTDVYWDGRLVKSFATDDNGAPQHLILNLGSSRRRVAAYGEASQMKVDYVRAFVPR